MARIFSLSALTVLELPPPDMVTCARDAGYSHVGLRLVPATPTEVSYDTIGDTPIIRQTLARLADTGVMVLDVEILRLKPETKVGEFRGVLETAARLGATNALVADNDPDEARFTDNFAALCDLAAPFGIAPNLEPMPWTEARNFAQGARIVGNAKRANAGLLIDPLHFDRGGSVASEIGSVPTSWIRYIQMCDVPAQRPTTLEGLLHHARSERMLPGEGGLDLAGILRAVPADTPISLEIPQEQLAKTMPAVERSRRALAALQELVQSTLT
ncbi:MAG TPA: TIM barrel protein [Casimicrobiaceae bacterium]|nr:TIM barrel protein [Casimicrobiaceae bacterium]